jgi:hypothetical protein
MNEKKGMKEREREGIEKQRECVRVKVSEQCTSHDAVTVVSHAFLILHHSWRVTVLSTT